MTTFQRLSTASRPLTAAGLALLALAPVLLAAMVLDPRLILGAPAWLKPLKFAVSTGVFCLTLAWIFHYLPGWRRLRAVVGWMTAGVFAVEVGIISLQAWRGTTSHFNIGTPLDATLFSVMGALIFLQTGMTVLVAVALWRQRFDDAALGWALRLGLVLSILGASTGGLMTAPTAAQLADARAGSDDDDRRRAHGRRARRRPGPAGDRLEHRPRRSARAALRRAARRAGDSDVRAAAGAAAARPGEAEPACR